MGISSNPQVALAASFTLGCLVIRTGKAQIQAVMTPLLILLAMMLALVAGVLWADSMGVQICVSDPLMMLDASDTER